MRRHLLRTILFSLTIVAFAQDPSQKTPYWAYAVNPPSATPDKAPDTTVRHVPNSGAAFTNAQIQDLFGVPDWHPASHPAMPEIVARGRQPGVYACAYCHLPNGEGRPENATIAGLPAEYILRQLADYKSGARKSSEPSFKPAANMPVIATNATDQEIQAAAQYFSQLQPKAWIRVVERNNVPTTHVSGWMLVASTPPATEPIGHRIIEMPEDLERTELRDCTTGGTGKTAACAKCHGPGLRGTGNVPPIAGRSPSYIVRQLYDFQSGVRSGASSSQMRPTVEKLNIDDMIAVAAYVASLRP